MRRFLLVVCCALVLSPAATLPAPAAASSAICRARLIPARDTFVGPIIRVRNISCARATYLLRYRWSAWRAGPRGWRCGTGPMRPNEPVQQRCRSRGRTMTFGIAY
jgi:hypothetical protein